ncbi:MAG: hypothetical protein HY752_02700 [Nitrospirae bacterium]|nr:hypothetical protein [Nitrospirota bacterium]
MKKIVALVFSLVLVVAFTLTMGCKKPETTEVPAPAPAPTEPAPAPTEPAPAQPAK